MCCAGDLQLDDAGKHHSDRARREEPGHQILSAAPRKCARGLRNAPCPRSRLPWYRCAVARKRPPTVLWTSVHHPHSSGCTYSAQPVRGTTHPARVSFFGLSRNSWAWNPPNQQFASSPGGPDRGFSALVPGPHGAECVCQVMTGKWRSDWDSQREMNDLLETLSER